MEKLRQFESNFRAGKYLLLSIERYRKHVGDDRRAFGRLFWATTLIIVCFILFALFSEVTGALLISHIAMALLAIIPVGHVTQQLITYQASSPRHLLLDGFAIGKKSYKINRKSGISLVVTDKNKRLNLQDFSDLELFFASISSFTKLAPNIESGLSIKNNYTINYESGFLPNLHYASGQYGTAKNRSTFIVGPVAELLPYLDELWDHGHVRRLSANDRSKIAEQAIAMQKNTTYTLAAAYLPHDHTQDGTKLDAVTIKKHGVLVGLASLKTKRDAKLFAADAVHNIRVGSRSTLALAVSLLGLITASFLLATTTNTPPLMTFSLLLFLKFIIEPLPAMSVVWDGIFKNHKVEQEPHQTRSHSVWDGIIAATLVMAAYVTSFYSYGYAPSDAATASALHGRGLSIVLLSITGCYLMTVLSQRHSTGIFNVKQLHNRMFGIGLTFTVLVSLLLVYATPISAFGLLGLPYQDLGLVVVVVGLFAIISEVRRHTENTNSREALITLLGER